MMKVCYGVRDINGKVLFKDFSSKAEAKNKRNELQAKTSKGIPEVHENGSCWDYFVTKL